MTAKKLVQLGEKLPLQLTAAQRKLVLAGLLCIDQEYEQTIRATAAGKPILLSLDDLEDLGGHIAAASNHTNDARLQKKLDAAFQKIQDLLDSYTDEEPPNTLKFEDAQKAKVLSDQVLQIADWAAKAFIVAEQLGIKEKPLPHFRLAPAQREVLLLVPGVTKAIKSKLAMKESSFSVAEVTGMLMALAEDLPDGKPQKQVAVLFLARHLMDQIEAGLAGQAHPKGRKSKRPKTKAVTKTLFQFKITLKSSTPPIWRRIQVMDCTLDKLHEHIQTAMGWTNSHLHQFEINKQRYADPTLMEETFEAMECKDSTRTHISQILPKDGKRFRFIYEYDFGDSWHHEILFEGCPKPESGQTYPLCLEGERACPPEDVGGIGGFYELIEALGDPKHERHEELLEWNGPFDPNEFNAGEATRAMKRGLPNWKD